MHGFVQNIGCTALNFLAAFGRITLFSATAIRWIFTPPYYWQQLLRQIIDIGYFSLPVVGLTTLFSGMVLALQSYTGFARFSAEDTVATVVVLSVTRELGPVLAGLMVAGRIGASMAAEIGTMRVTDQIDALDTLSTRPMQYLVAPRLLAGTICLPFLVLVGDVIGVFGGYLVGVYRLGFNPSIYLARTLEYLEVSDVTLGLVKAAVFGFLIALMGWMPTAVDLSTWNSIWTLERTRSTGYKPSLKETLKEFNLGYLLSAILALGFLALGTLLLHRTGATLPDGSAGFAAGIVQLYADSIGAWSAPLMGAAAFSAMLGTCIAVMDGYARSLNRAFAAAMNTTPRDEHHRRALVLVAAGGLCLVLGYSGQIKLLVDIATTLSFLVAPVIAFWNLRLVTRSDRSLVDSLVCHLSFFRK